MVEIRTLQKDLLEGLVTIGFLQSYENGLSYSDISNRNLLKPKIVTAAICAGLYPQIGKIIRPAAKYVDTLGGKIERDVMIDELEFYILDNSGLGGSGDVNTTIVNNNNNNNSGNNSSKGLTNSSNKNSIPNSNNNNNKNNTTNTYNNSNNNSSNNNDNNNNNNNNNSQGQSRVFIHSSSVNYTNVTYKSSNYLLYSEKKLSNASNGSKPFLHEITEIPPFPLLFFGGEIEAQYTEGTVTVDDWIKFSAPGKLVVLILALRKSLNELLTEKILDPEFEISSSAILDAVCLLFQTDGLDSGN